MVLIADFEVKGLEHLKYHTKWKIIEEKERKTILTDKLELHIIEIPKVAWNDKSEEELIDWLAFLENPNSERVKKKMEENKELKQAVEKLEEISEDEHMQRIAKLREKAILDEKAIRELALEEGLEEGEKKAKLEDARKMLEEGIPLELVIKITGLTEEEIK